MGTKISRGPFLTKKEAEDAAIKITKAERGIIQHVERRGKLYYISDWYDYTKTVSSFVNGMHESVSRTPLRVARALPQTKELKQNKIGERFIEYLQDNGLKHAAYQNEAGVVKVLGLNKEQVKEVLKKVISTHKKNKNEGFPGGAGTGISLAGGYINGAPKEDDVENVKTSLGETDADPTVISTLKNVVRDGSKTMKDPKTGKNVRVDPVTANEIIKTYDSIKDKRLKERYLNAGLLKMQETASLVSKRIR